MTVTSTGFVPRAGDFDGDGRDDVLWYRPGLRRATWCGSAAPPRRVQPGVDRRSPVPTTPWSPTSTATAPTTSTGTAAAPRRRRSGEAGSACASFVARGIGTGGGAYRPVAGDGDGDGDDEITWYAPGTAADKRWSGVPGSIVVRNITVNGDYLPLAGDFDGDGRDDIAWYGPGGRTDWMWWGRADGSVDSTALDVRRDAG